MSEKKGSGLDIFDALEKKEPMPSDSGVLPRGGAESKAPPPPPSLRAPAMTRSSGPPPSLAQLSAPLARGSTPPPPLRAVSVPPPMPGAMRSVPPPPPSGSSPSGSRAPTPRTSAPPPPPPASRPSSPQLSRSPSVPGAPLPSYGGESEDDLPTRLYSSGTVPPPALPAPPPRQAPLSRGEGPTPSTGPAQRYAPPPAPATAPAGQTPRNPYYVAGAGLAAVLLAAYLFTGRSGSVTVTATGPGGRPLEDVRIFIDGIDRCDKSPCQIDDVKPGAHFIRATAKGHLDTADQAISIASGAQTTQNIQMVPAAQSPELRVSAIGSGLKLWIDGQELGELPQTVKDLTPGEHRVKIAGNDRYEPYEETVRVEEGQAKALGPVQLKVLKGLATFKAGPGADGARVLLDGRLVPELPSTIEVPAGKQLSLVATKKGYSTFRRAVAFDDGVAEKTFEITLAEGTDDTSPATDDATTKDAGSAKDSARSKAAAKAPAATAPKKPAPAAPTPAPAPAKAVAGDKAVLTLSAVPPANVIVNGRPLGQTPKTVRVAPGPQTVVFVHPTLGRKVMSATVAAGETKALSAKMK